LFLNLDFTALNYDLPALSVALGNRRYDIETDNRARRTPDPVDHVVQTPATPIAHFAVLALRDADNAVSGLQLALFVSRAGGNQAHHLGVVVLHLQHGANTFELEAHIDLEVFRQAGGEIVGMGVVKRTHRIGIGLKYVLRLDLLKAL